MRQRGLEQRRAKRTPRRNAAWIERAGEGAHIPCVLWDLSEGGARLAAPHTGELPPAFKLLLSRDGSSQRLCRVVWRSDKQLGVQFIQDWIEDLTQPATAPAATAHAARSIDVALLASSGGGLRAPHAAETTALSCIRYSSIAAGILLIAATTVLALVVRL